MIDGFDEEILSIMSDALSGRFVVMVNFVRSHVMIHELVYEPCSGNTPV